MRRCYSEGAIATVERRGAEDAGVIFVIIDKLSGAADLYGPAPQSSFDEARPSDRKFQRVIAEENLATIASRMEREIRFDPDLWIVAVEDRDGRTFFETI